MSEDQYEITPEPKVEPEPVKDKKPDALKCPAGFPKERWDTWCDAERLNYLTIIENSNRITGGK